MYKGVPMAAPADVTGLTDETIYGAIELEWDESTEADYAETELRRDGTDWASAVPLTGNSTVASATLV